MALSGTIYGPWLGSGYHRVYMTWSATQSIANNTSTITADLYWQSTGFSLSDGVSKGVSISIGGRKSSSTSNATIGSSQTKRLHRYTRTVSHNSNGSASVTLEGVFDLRFTLGGTYYSSTKASGTVTLNTIPRKSDLTGASIYSLQASSSNTLSISRSVKYTGFYHLVSILDGSTWIWDTGYISGSPSTSYTIPAATVNKMLNRMGSVTKKTFRVRLRTYSRSGGNGYIGESFRNLTVNVHSSVTPSITSRTVSEYVNGLNAQFGAYVQNKSRLSLAMNASAGYGASVRSYRIVANGTTYTTRTATTGELKNSGSQTITFEVTDSRGRKATVTNTINVIAYSPPRINSLTAERANSSGTINDEGTHALIKYNVAISPVGNKNTKSFILRYRQNGTDSWQSITLDNANYSYNTSRVIGPLNVDYAFDVQLVVKDYFDEIFLTEIVQSTFTLINFAANKRGLAFGATYNEATGGIVQIDGHLVPYFTEVEEW